MWNDRYERLETPLAFILLLDDSYFFISIFIYQFIYPFIYSITLPPTDNLARVSLFLSQGDDVKQNNSTRWNDIVFCSIIITFYILKFPESSYQLSISECNECVTPVLSLCPSLFLSLHWCSRLTLSRPILPPLLFFYSTLPLFVLCCSRPFLPPAVPSRQDTT